MTNSQIKTILEKRYPADQYALMTEVSDAPGVNRSRSADFIAMGLWPSRGLSIIGFELKASRSDWLRELKDHAKAENIFKYCDYWYLFTTDEAIAKPEEIPDTWGWITIKGDCIKEKKAAPKLSPVAMTKGFMACMLKRAADKTDYVHITSIQEKIDKAKKDAVEYESGESKNRMKDYRQLLQDVGDFENASGIQIRSGWHSDSKKIGTAVKVVMSGGTDVFLSRLELMEHQLDSLHSAVKQSISQLKPPEDASNTTTNM